MQEYQISTAIKVHPLGLYPVKANGFSVGSATKGFRKRNGDAGCERIGAQPGSAVVLCAACQRALQSQRLRVDLDANILSIDGVDIGLSPTQAEILDELLRRAPKVVTHDALISAVWGIAGPSEPRSNLKVHISNLNKLLAPHGAAIVSRFGAGYRFQIEVR